MSVNKKPDHLKWGDIPQWATAAVQSIINSLKLVDPETAAHCLRVGEQSLMLAKAAGFNDFEAKMAEFAGILHDVGKMGISKNIIHKPGKLDDAEYKLMMDHPNMSVEIIKPLMTHEFFSQVAQVVVAHHERVDGKGYPNKLAGDEIPVLARVVFIVDAYDAMTHNRSYRNGLPKEWVYTEIKNCSGTQFDQNLAKIFLQSQGLWSGDFSKLDTVQKNFKKAG